MTTDQLTTNQLLAINLIQRDLLYKMIVQYEETKESSVLKKEKRILYKTIASELIPVNLPPKLKIRVLKCFYHSKNFLLLVILFFISSFDTFSLKYILYSIVFLLSLLTATYIFSFIPYKTFTNFLLVGLYVLDFILFSDKYKFFCNQSKALTNQIKRKIEKLESQMKLYANKNASDTQLKTYYDKILNDTITKKKKAEAQLNIIPIQEGEIAKRNQPFFIALLSLLGVILFCFIFKKQRIFEFLFFVIDSNKYLKGIWDVLFFISGALLFLDKISLFLSMIIFQRYTIVSQWLFSTFRNKENNALGVIVKSFIVFFFISQLYFHISFIFKIYEHALSFLKSYRILNKSLYRLQNNPGVTGEVFNLNH